MYNIKDKNIVENWKTSKYDRKNKLNRSNTNVSTEIITEIDKGITIETLDKLQNEYKLPIFKYNTQITIHGNFDELNFNYINGYKNVLQNKNKSIGIRWNAIDAEKRNRIAKSLRYVGLGYVENSTKHTFYKWEYIKDNADELLKEYTTILQKFQNCKFYGNAEVYTGTIYGCKMIALDVNINAIYESEVENLIANLGVNAEIIAKKDAEEKAKNDASDLAYNQKCEIEMQKRKALMKQAVVEIEKNNHNLQPRNNIEIGIGYSIETSVYGDNNSYKFKLINVYKEGRKKFPRVFERTFDTFKEMLEYIENKKEVTYFSDRILRHNIKVISFKENTVEKSEPTVEKLKIHSLK